MSDEEIAKRCGLKVSDVRAVLNKLHEYGITNYIRERDKDTGWFSYNWIVNVIRLYEIVQRRNANGAKRDKEALAFEKSYVFYTCNNASCPGHGQRVPEPEAILTTYMCDRCGSSLNLFDNKEIIKSIEERLASRASTEQTFIEAFKKARKVGARPLKKKPLRPSKKKAKPRKLKLKPKLKARPKTRPKMKLKAKAKLKRLSRSSRKPKPRAKKHKAKKKRRS